VVISRNGADLPRSFWVVVLLGARVDARRALMVAAAKVS
jgi:hypothetical protein